MARERKEIKRKEKMGVKRRERSEEKRRGQKSRGRGARAPKYFIGAAHLCRVRLVCSHFTADVGFKAIF